MSHILKVLSDEQVRHLIDVVTPQLPRHVAEQARTVTHILMNFDYEGFDPRYGLERYFLVVLQLHFHTMPLPGV